MRAFTLTVAVIAATTFASKPARAEDGRVRTLRYDTAIDGTITGIGAIWLIASEVYKAELVPKKCRWCYRAPNGDDALNPYDGWVRRRLLWKDTQAADTASSVAAFIVMPLLGFGGTGLVAAHDGASRDIPVDALLVTEATILAASVNQMTKFAFARERPFVHFRPTPTEEAVQKLTSTPSDDNLSFFSGHTTLAFAIATSSGTVATMRNYRLAPLVWGGGLLVASSVGYLRIAADKHYLTDVLTAVAVGSLIGVAVPLLFHAPAGGGGATTTPAAVAQLTRANGPMWSLGGAW